MELRSPLYGILDLGYTAPEDAATVSDALLAGGVGILQVRAKQAPAGVVGEIAGKILAHCRAAGVPLIINDYPALAGEVDADGFHLGQDDGESKEAIHNYHAARPAGLPDRHPIVGRSTHSVQQAVAAHMEPVDYIGFGPLFTTPTKPGRPAIGTQDIATVHNLLPNDFPIFPIGGIKLENLADLVALGARRAVIVSGLLQAEDIAEAARRAIALLPAS